MTNDRRGAQGRSPAAEHGSGAVRCRVWSVTAVMAEGAQPVAGGGVVVAADLDLAAAQLCTHLEQALADTGRCYLLATRDAVGIQQGEQRTSARLLARVRWDAAAGSPPTGTG
ncbi:hypothetical protein [Nocardia sp. NPDC048505]|uniref:hypothetical protein n=1 Tax=unclassified Nocardia TaxID=2637762 RepID=UPI0033EE7BB6